MILCSGAFDGLHSGHVAYLKAAKKLDPSQQLAVAIAPDHYIVAHKHRSPRWSQLQRAETVRALEVVDMVIYQHQDSVAETIREFKPSMVVKGQDWIGKIPHDVAAVCVETGAQLVFTDTDERHSRQVDWDAIGGAL